jgi:superfamily II DNA helicase RecQ
MKFRSYSQVFEVWAWLVDALGDRVFTQHKISARSRKVEMYHSSTDADTKRWIMEDFTKCDSTIKVLVCTIAFGMGVSISDTEIVIHWGAPKSILAYWQEIGRSGRSGQYSYAIMYPYKHSLISNMVTEEIKTLSKSSECLRKYALTN